MLTLGEADCATISPALFGCHAAELVVVRKDDWVTELADKQGGR